MSGWSPLANLVGPPGPVGPAGPAGPQGPAPDTTIFETLANKNAPNGYLGADGSGLLARTKLPVTALNFRGPWQATTVYNTNDVVTYLGGVYVANSNFTSGGAFVAANWTQLGVTPNGVVNRTIQKASRPDGANITDAAWHDLVGVTLPAMSAQPLDVALRLVVRPRQTSGSAAAITRFQVVTNDANLTPWLDDNWYPGAPAGGNITGTAILWWMQERVVFDRIIAAGTAVPALKARVQNGAAGVLDLNRQELASGEYARIEQVYG